MWAVYKLSGGDIIKGFALDEHGDVLIESGAIQMVQGSELTKQTIKTVLGTKKGEWFLNWEEGINYNEILGKKRLASQNTANEVRENRLGGDL